MYLKWITLLECMGWDAKVQMCTQWGTVGMLFYVGSRFCPPLFPPRKGPFWGATRLLSVLTCRKRKNVTAMPLPPPPPAQALPCLSTRTRPTVVFPTALLSFLLWALPCRSTRTRLTVVFLTFSVLAQGGGGWHKASVSDCLPLAAPIGLSPLLILTPCGPERVLVVSTEPPDDLSCLTAPGVGRPRAVDQVHPDARGRGVTWTRSHMPRGQRGSRGGKRRRRRRTT